MVAQLMVAHLMVVQVMHLMLWIVVRLQCKEQISAGAMQNWCIGWMGLVCVSCRADDSWVWLIVQVA